jgi:mannosyl-3-phosphoglycerate phosphatase
MLPSGRRTASAQTIVVLSDGDDSQEEPFRRGLDAATRATLARLTRQGVPIVFASDKTRAELEVIQQELGISHPFICESGAAVFVPRGYFGMAVPQAREVAGYETVEFGRPYNDVVTALRHSAARLGIAVRGFSDMSVDDVAAACSLPPLQARLAKLREYSEPFRVLVADSHATGRLFGALRAVRIHCTTRGSYHYAGTVRRDVAAQFLSRLYRRAFGEVETIAFGDLDGEVVPRR